MRKKGKKRGNTILLVLAISMILVLIGGVTVTSILNTTRLNHSSKIIDDLVYASESGLELAIGEVRGGNLVFNESKKINGTRFDTILKTDVVDRVDVSSTKISDNEYELESIAYSKRNNSIYKKAKTKIQRNNISNAINPDGDIMKNGLGAGTGNIAILGSDKADLDLSNTNINSPNKPDFAGDEDESKYPKPGNTGDQEYNKIEIDDSKIAHKDRIEVNSIADLKNLAKDITGDIKSESGVGIISSPSNPVYKVIIVNTKELVIKNKSPETLYKEAILTNGDIVLDGVALHAIDSTIYGNKLKMANGGSLNVNGSFQYTNTFPAGQGISEADMKELDGIISNYITNWDKPGTGDGSGSGNGNALSDFEFVDGTFEYE